MNFFEYLNLNGIDVVDGFSNRIEFEKYTTKDFEEQIKVINYFHKSLKGYSGGIDFRIGSIIGKTLEEYKINVKKARKYLNNTKNLDEKSEFELLFVDEGGLYIERAETCIKSINNNNYMNLILRSMRNKELCLEKTDPNNLRREKKIKVIDTSSLCYDLVEMDCFNLISRAKRRGNRSDFVSLVELYCELEGLGADSKNYILSLLSYPYEFMKCCNRYFLNKKQWDMEKHIEKLKQSIIIEKELFI